MVFIDIIVLGNKPSAVIRKVDIFPTDSFPQKTNKNNVPRRFELNPLDP